jgi:hypothetical protein
MLHEDLIETHARCEETPVLTRATRRNIPEDTILHSHRRENLKSYTYLFLFSQLIRDNLSSTASLNVPVTECLG